MAVKIAEAIGDESGKSRGGIPGDQTGNEILIRTWKPRSYDFKMVLRCTDRAMARRAADIARRIALCSKFGYNQTARWSGANNIEAVGVDFLEEAKAGDFDCSSLCLEVYKLAGLDIKHTGNTSSLPNILLKTGKFTELTSSKYTSSTDYAMTGDIYDAPGIHALITLEDGTKAERESDEPDVEPIISGPFVEIIRGKVNVRKTPRIPVKSSSNVYLVAKKGDTFPYLNMTETDETGKVWWAVRCDDRTCYISSENTKHAILVGNDN